MASKRDLVRTHLLDFVDGADPGTAIAADGAGRDRGAGHRGHLVRRPGRGTFTSPRKVTRELSADAASPLGVPPVQGTWTSRVVALRVRAAGAARAARFGMAADAEVVHITRVRVVDAEPIAIERLELPRTLVPGLAAADLEAGNLYHLLRDRYGVAVRDAVQTLEPAVANPHEADLLDVPVYFPLLRIERTTADAAGRTVEFTQSVYRSDRYRITSRLCFDHSSGVARY